MPFPSESRRSFDASPEEETLARRRRILFDAARAQWPDVDVDFDHFCSELDRLGYQRDQPAHGASLYLCMACGRGDDVACHALEVRYFPALRTFLAAFDGRPEVVDDLLQQLRERLLVGPNPRIRMYGGKGALAAWLRKVAQAIAVDSLRANVGRRRFERRLQGDCAYAELVHATRPLQPDEHADRERYERLAFRALSQAVQALPAPQRQLLRHYYVGGMSIDQLGSLYSIDRSTAARRLGRVLREVQRMLGAELADSFGPLTAKELLACGSVLYRASGPDEVEPSWSDVLQLDAPSSEPDAGLLAPSW